MVDLAKIRKKSKKKGGEDETPPGEGHQVTGSPGHQADPAPVASAAPDAGDAPATDVPPAVSQPVEASPAAPPAKDERTSKLERFMAEAGKKRDAVAAAAEVTDASGLTEMLTFVIAGESYAVGIDDIVEIVRPRPVTRIPNADATIVGITSLRGTIVTLVDAHLKLRHRGRPEPTDDTRVVVVDRNHEILGFTVDRVLRVVKVAPDAIEPPPIVHASEQHDAILGVFRVAGALTILLDLDKLLDHKVHGTDGSNHLRRTMH